ncbi:MAG TPA: hypothetical protein VM925_31290 [Labilithrix sp.]|nr:hypothetical protein [Labilithrix sp.]
MDSQLVLCGDLRPFTRPFRPMVVFGVMIASWALGCALANDKNDGARSGLHAGGPLSEGCFMTAKIDCPLRCSEIDFDAVCDATLGASCDGTCAAEATGTCLDDCSADCAIGCSAGADTECRGMCWDRCGDNCKKLCAGAINPQQCSDACGGECRSTCAEECRSTSDSSCDGSCKASCHATCSVEAHVACQLRCSVDGFTTCKAKVAAQCVAECSSAVMLTCADPNGHREDAPAPVLAPPTEASTDGGVWIHRPEDDVLQRGGLARQRTRAEGDAPLVVEAPPIVEAPPPDAPDASAETTE